MCQPDTRCLEWRRESSRASALDAARAFAASDIFFFVAAEITLLVVVVDVETGAAFLTTSGFVAVAGTLAADLAPGVADRVYFLFPRTALGGTAGWFTIGGATPAYP
jgi:hypothetical protein